MNGKKFVVGTVIADMRIGLLKKRVFTVSLKNFSYLILYVYFPTLEG